MELSLDGMIDETVSSGIAPISVSFTKVYDGYSERPNAYIGETQLFTSDSGVIDSTALEALDNSPLGFEVFKSALKKVMRVWVDTRENETPPAYLVVKAPIGLLFQDGLYDTLKAICEEEDLKEPEKICFKFTQKILADDRDKIKAGLRDVKAAGFLVGISGFGGEDFPATALFDVKADIVFLTPEMTARLTDRADSGAAMNLLVFVRSMGVETIAEGVKDDDTNRQLQKAEALGMIPDKAYEGEFNFNFDKATADEIVGMEN